jgi:hypothetical protein
MSAAMASMLGKPRPHSIPIWMARMAAFAGDIIGPRFPLDTKRLKKITSSLIFADLKARKAFGWSPRPALIAYKPN